MEKLLCVPGQSLSNNPDKFDKDRADLGDANVRKDNIECGKNVGSMVDAVGVGVAALKLYMVEDRYQETSCCMPCSSLAARAF